MYEIRCTQCSKLLLKSKEEYEASTQLIQYELEVQCTRCKAINHYKTK